MKTLKYKMKDDILWMWGGDYTSIESLNTEKKFREGQGYQTKIVESSKQFLV